MVDHDTICAISSPPGTGAIAVVRLSGPKAVTISSKVFHPAAKGKKLSQQKPYTIHFGTLQDKDRIIDEVLVSLFHAPHSYTGENMVEISCHGAVYIQQEILQLLIRHGARSARAGEFTLRAFLNGRMDLSQAEAVADLIASTSKASHKVAIYQIRGGFSEEIRKLRERLLHFASMVELELDFAEEEVEFADRTELGRLVENILSMVKSLSDSFALGNVIKNGVPVAIVGKPNVGKSTLLNALLKEERAIVSEIAGTTRDAIEDTLTLGGFTFRFIDTAGIRESSDTIENLGIRKTYQKIEQSSVVLLLVDARDTLEIICQSYKHILAQAGNHDRRIILVIHKTDLVDPSLLKRKFASKNLACLRDIDLSVLISAKNTADVHALSEKLIGLMHLEKVSGNEVIITNARHYEALERTAEALTRIQEGLEHGYPGDLLAQDIRMAIQSMGEITGEITTDEILGNIFSRFCIGK
jgi:tRNA modification GTPase